MGGKKPRAKPKQETATNRDLLRRMLVHTRTVLRAGARMHFETEAELDKHRFACAGAAHNMLVHMTEQFNLAPVSNPSEKIALWTASLESYIDARLRDIDGQSERETQPGEVDEIPAKMDGRSRAFAVLIEHPEWANKQIAAAAGLHPKTLSRYPDFRAARAMLRKSGKANLPRGYKTADGNIEAY
jgi:hypothetical protein